MDSAVTGRLGGGVSGSVSQKSGSFVTYLTGMQNSTTARTIQTRQVMLIA